MMSTINNISKLLIVSVLVTFSASRGLAQSDVLKSLRSDFKQLTFDSLHLSANITFEHDKTEFPTLQTAIIDTLNTHHSKTSEFTNEPIHKAVGSFLLTKKFRAYLVRAWSENEREYQTFLYVVRIKRRSYSVINRYNVGTSMGSECCEFSSGLKVLDSNNDGYLDLIINENQRETTAVETITKVITSVYIWNKNDFKLESFSSVERHDCE